MEENTAEISLVKGRINLIEAKLNFIEAELNFIKVAVGSFEEYLDEKKRTDFLKEEFSLIPDESWRDQFYAYARFSEEQLIRELNFFRKEKVELQKEETLLQNEKFMRLGLSAAQQDQGLERFIENPRFVKQMEHILNTPSETLLDALKREEYFKSFGSLVPEGNHVPSNIFIRRAYRELTYQTLADLRNRIGRRRLYQQIITGTPGIGKSIFLSYLVHFLAQVDGVTHIVIDFAQESDSKQIFHFSRSRPVSSTSANTSVPNSWRWSLPFDIDRATLYVSDPRAGDKVLPDIECHHVVICSPNFNYVKDLISKDAFPVMVMPVFSFEELVSLNNLMPNKFNEEELVARYRKYGGVPRHVFGSEEYLKSEDSVITRKIRELEPKQLVTISAEIREGHLFFEANSIPNTLFHMMVEPTGTQEEPDLDVGKEIMHEDDTQPVEPTLNYEKPIRKLGSPYYQKLFLVAVNNMGDRESTLFLIANRHNPLLAPVTGKIFEGLLIKALQNNQMGDLNGYMLQEKDEGKNIPVTVRHNITKEKMFSDEQFNETLSKAVLERNNSTLFHPSSEIHATYDIYILADVKIGTKDFTPALLGVQVTKASSHNVALTGLERLAALGTEMEFPVYTAFFVEDWAANQYLKEQPVSRNDGQKGMHAPKVKQFVVPIEYSEWFLYSPKPKEVVSTKNPATAPLSSSRSSERQLDNEDEYLEEQDTKEKVILSQTSSSHIPKQSGQSSSTAAQTRKKKEKKRRGRIEETVNKRDDNEDGRG